jgi:hypothetical protein
VEVEHAIARRWRSRVARYKVFNYASSITEASEYTNEIMVYTARDEARTIFWYFANEINGFILGYDSSQPVG